jgi:septum formation protein
MRLILASSSPRRAELLGRIGIPFEVRDPNVAEDSSEEIEDRILTLARRKALAVRAPDAWTIGADTMVAVDGRALGKPANAEEAAAVLRGLAGRAHDVHTGVAVVGPTGTVASGSARTTVCFVPFDDATARAYVERGEWRGKAGGYAIQEGAEVFVDRIEGSWSNVVGLPLALTVRLLDRSAFPLPPHCPRVEGRRGTAK